MAPAAGILTAFVTAAGALAVDRWLLDGSGPLPLYDGSADTARTLLSVTVTSLATIIALVLTIVTVVLQLASDKYSHRALRTFLRDTQSHVFLFTAAGTFAYALVVLLLLDLTIEPDSGRVVGIAIPLAFVGAILSLGVFVRSVDHIVHASRGTAIIARIADESRRQVGRVHPESHDAGDPSPAAPPESDPVRLVRAPEPGVVEAVEVDPLAAWAAEHDAVVVVAVGVGRFVPGGAPMLAIHGLDEDDDDVGDGAEPGVGNHRVARTEPDDRAGDDGPDNLGRLVRLDAEATITADVRFGFRLLVDIGENAISPGVNDPTTAVQCIDQLHDLLLLLSGRALGQPWIDGPDGQPRVYLPTPGWEDYVGLAGDELRLYGSRDLQVVRRLRAMWLDLLDVVPEDRRPAVQDQLERLETAADRDLPPDLADWRDDDGR
nr:DUF2254 domain-containing protein [Salsipaludibacter albus]